jgi:hypothetical protein
MTKTGTVIMGVMVDGVIMMDGVIAVAAVDGGRVPILASTLDRLTPPTDTMRILLHTGITDTLHTGTTADTRTEDCPRTPPMEGRGWADRKATTADGTYTGKGGTKRP